MRKRIAIGGLVALALFFAGGAANAARVRIGTLVLRADGGFEPRLLPKRAYAPIDFRGHADIGTTDDSMPPALRLVKLEFDRDGKLDSTGLAACPPARIEGATPQQARHRCKAAIVGSGQVGATIGLPGQARVEISSPLTLFNGPRQAGHPTVVAHAQATFPAVETYVVVVPIERRSGAYRYRASFEVPEIAGGYGALTHADVEIGRRYRSHGATRSYVSARCSDYILQTRAYLSFADGTIVSGSIFKTCRPRP
jgi:hypothetical protein